VPHVMYFRPFPTQSRAQYPSGIQLYLPSPPPDEHIHSKGRVERLGAMKPHVRSAANRINFLAQKPDIL
jgi:hypothetical protein